MFEPSKGGSSPLASSFLQNRATQPTAAPGGPMPQIAQPVQAPMNFGSMAPRPMPQQAPKRFAPSMQAQFLLGMGANPRAILGDNYAQWAKQPANQGQLWALNQRSSSGRRGGSR